VAKPKVTALQRYSDKKLGRKRNLTLCALNCFMNSSRSLYSYAKNILEDIGYGAFHPNPRNNSNSSSTTCDNNLQMRQRAFFAPKLVANIKKRHHIVMSLFFFHPSSMGLDTHAASSTQRG
jgi:hypothetical protein